MIGAMVEMLKFRRYFVQFIVWKGIPNTLPFGTDVVSYVEANISLIFHKINRTSCYLFQMLLNSPL